MEIGIIGIPFRTGSEPLAVPLSNDLYRSSTVKAPSPCLIRM